MKQRKNNGKLNNRGLSLVELLVAVTILAVITVPMLHMFVTSGKINAKSRVTLRATFLAQDVLESLKAYHVEELQDQFNGREDFVLVDRSLLDGATLSEDIAQEGSENGTDADGNPKPGLYYFTMKNVHMEKSRFDVRIKVDARGYTEGTAVTSAHEKRPNSSDVAYITSMNKDTDASYPQKKQLEVDVFQEVRNKLGLSGGEDVDYDTPGLECRGRKITVYFKDGSVDADGNQKTEAKIGYEYTFKYNSEPEFTVKVPLTPDATGAYATPCGDFTGSNFYLFYDPVYELPAGTRDEIVIDCSGGLSAFSADRPLNIYIAKQTDTELTDTQLYVAENAYEAKVDVKGLDKEKFRIRTNLGYHLVNDTYLKSVSAKKEILAQVEYYHNGAIANKSLNIFNLSGIRDKEHGADGADDEVLELMYDVQVEVYEAGAADAGFPSGMRKVSLDGSKNH